MNTSDSLIRFNRMNIYMRYESMKEGAKVSLGHPLFHATGNKSKKP